MNARALRRLGLAIAILIAAFLAWWDPSAEPAPRALTRADLPDHGDAPEPDEGPFEPTTAGRSGPRPPKHRSCKPHAELACHEGDLHWFDSCGGVEELSEACEGRGCSEGRCVPATASENPCGRLSAWGECLGDIAQACIERKIVAVDCGARRERCVMTSEGAACMPRDDKNGCRGYEPATCNGTQLSVCVDGRWRSIDCAARKGVCSDTASGAHCELNAPIALGPLPGGPVEQCDGKDNDGDGEIDESGACDPIPLVAFVPEGAKLRELDTRMADELAILNRVLSPATFRWAKTVPVSSSYRAFDPDNMEALAAQLGQSESRAYQAKHGAPLAAAGEQASFDFYIAVLYTEKLKLDPPKSGISTLPNARCGGVRLSDAPSPVSGLIVLSEARQPETLTHEMGHYLGLCHTHEQVSRFAAPYPDEPACEYTGDSICDTPDDPGPTQCYQAEPCTLSCRQPARPDPFNIMSYYIPCRRLLTPEQVAEMRRNLSLRRGWFRCQDPHDCPCDPKRKLACPTEMSCHPAQKSDAQWMCELDGPALPGANCSGASHCSLRSFCIGKSDGSSRCVRPCDEEPGCTCQDVGLPIRVCAEDL
jgi:hypothetical protein